MEKENLREYYITPFYLGNMNKRVKKWSIEHIKRQLILFRRTIADYPEVLEILEGELHSRNLNKLHKFARKKTTDQLKTLLKKYEAEPDYQEIITTELEIRKGTKKLYDSSGET